MPSLEESIIALLARAGAVLVVALVIIGFVFRRHVATAARDIRRDWSALRVRVHEPIALTLLTIAAILVRLPYLSRTMGTDESASFLYYASKPLLLGVTIYGSPNNHILHTALMHAAFAIFGDRELALRLPAFLAGVAMVPLTYIAGGGLIAAAAVATWPVLIDYSTDARGYTLLCCFVLICVAAIREARATGNRAAIAIFIVAAALGFFTIPVMVYPFVLLLAWCGWRKETAVCAIGTIALTLLLYVPTLVVSGVDAIASNPYVRPLPIGVFFRLFPLYVVHVFRALSAGVPLVLLLLVLFFFVWRILGLPWAVVLYWTTGVVAVLLLLLFQRVLPFPRVWLPFLPLVFIAIGKPPHSKLLATCVAIALASCAIAARLRETGELRAAPEIARELRIRARPGDPVLTLPPSDMPLAFYTGRMHVPVEIRFPDVRRRRLFLVVNRDYGQTLSRFPVNLRSHIVRRVRDFGSAALYELTRR